MALEEIIKRLSDSTCAPYQCLLEEAQAGFAPRKARSALLNDSDYVNQVHSGVLKRPDTLRGMKIRSIPASVQRDLDKISVIGNSDNSYLDYREYTFYN